MPPRTPLPNQDQIQKPNCPAVESVRQEAQVSVSLPKLPFSVQETLEQKHFLKMPRKPGRETGFLGPPSALSGLNCGGHWNLDCFSCSPHEGVPWKPAPQRLGTWSRKISSCCPLVSMFVR